MSAFIEIVKYAVIVFLLLILAISYYREEYLPRFPVYYFRRMLRDFRKVINGEISYFYFSNHYFMDCQIINPKDSTDLRSFKDELMGMLQCEDFIKRTLSDSSITYYGFKSAWEKYNPNMGAGDRDNPSILPEDISELEIPPILSTEKGRNTMEKMVQAGYCEPITYKWKEDYSTYLMALFAYAIIQEMDNEHGVWAALTSLWGNNGKNNISSLKTQALGAKNSKHLIETVQGVFPLYNPSK